MESTIGNYQKTIRLLDDYVAVRGGEYTSALGAEFAALTTSPRTGRFSAVRRFNYTRLVALFDSYLHSGEVALVGQVDKVFEDYASGGSRKRPQLDELLRHIRHGDQVRVASMDRLARSVIDLNQITDEILSKGAQLQFLSENLT